MKRSNRFLTGLLAAAITFGALFAIAGPENFAKHKFHHHRYESCDHYRHQDVKQQQPVPATHSATDSIK